MKNTPLTDHANQLFVHVLTLIEQHMIVICAFFLLFPVYRAHTFKSQGLKDYKKNFKDFLKFVERLVSEIQTLKNFKNVSHFCDIPEKYTAIHCSMLHRNMS